jgi:peptidyl-prolyl cis-trans isomerase C
MRAIVLALVALPVAWSAPAFAQPAAPPAASTVAATVNGETITLAELDAVLTNNLPLVPLTAAQRKNLRAAVLNDLIDDRLVKQFLAKNGVKVDPAELDAQMKAFTEELAKDKQTLADYLKKTGQTEAQLRADWATSIQLTTYVEHQATDEKLKAYHEANRDFFDKVEVRVSHVLVRVSKGSIPGEKAAAREKIEAIRADVIAGKIEFADAARKFSQDPSARAGGDLGFIRRRGPELEEAFLKAAFALKAGDVSEILETSSGFHLLKVTDRKPGQPSTVEKCLLEVMDAFTDDYRTELVARLRKEGQIRVSLP